MGLWGYTNLANVSSRYSLVIYLLVIKRMRFYPHMQEENMRLVARCAEQQENSYVQVYMRVLDSIKGRGQVLDRAIVQVIRAHVDCSKITKFERSIMLSTIPKMLDSKLAYDCSYICAMQIKGSYIRLYAKFTSQGVLRPTKLYVLNSKCVVAIRLITRKYSIPYLKQYQHLSLSNACFGRGCDP